MVEKELRLFTPDIQIAQFTEDPSLDNCLDMNYLILLIKFSMSFNFLRDFFFLLFGGVISCSIRDREFKPVYDSFVKRWQFQSKSTRKWPRQLTSVVLCPRFQTKRWMFDWANIKPKFSINSHKFFIKVTSDVFVQNAGKKLASVIIYSSEAKLKIIKQIST